MLPAAKYGQTRGGGVQDLTPGDGVADSAYTSVRIKDFPNID